MLCFVLFFNPPAFLAPGAALPYVLLMYMFTGTLDSLIRWDVDAGFNGYYNHPAGRGYFKTAELWAVDDDWLCYYYDYLTVASALSAQEDPQRRAELAALLDESLAAQEQSSQAGRAALKAVLEGIPDTTLAFTAVGHSHLDLAWLWPMRETRRKAVRTFTHQIANMTRYPHYVYGASQPQQFQFVKESHPALYRQLQEFARRGQLECQGGMWVEADCLDNGILRIQFAPDCEIRSLTELATGQEYAGEFLNRLEDPVLPYNAWDIDWEYYKRPFTVLTACERETFADGPVQVHRAVYRHGDTEILQYVMLYPDSPVVYFKTQCRWQEKLRMLRADFAPAVWSD